jgi:hypothetical protein
MKRKEFVYIEKVVDKNGVERIYGYDSEGRKYFMNLEEVVAEYKKRGINSFKKVI